MDALLIVLGEHVRFDAGKILHDLQDIPGVSEIKTAGSFDSIIECRYEYDNDITTVRLSTGGEVISARGIGDASLQVAIELQRREEKPLRVFNQSWDFDFLLKSIDTLEEFKQKIQETRQLEVA